MFSLTETDFIQFLLKKERKPKSLTFPLLATFHIFTCIFDKTTIKKKIFKSQKCYSGYFQYNFKLHYNNLNYNLNYKCKLHYNQNFTVIQIFKTIFKTIIQTVHFYKDTCYSHCYATAARQSSFTYQ